MINSNPNSPSFIFDDLPLPWLMTRCEKFALAALLDAAAPEVAIEIGTYKGGSLQVISRKSKWVYSLDITPCSEALAGHFKNVEFITGPSRDSLPGVLKQLNQEGRALDFVLIDGCHSTESVRYDINSILEYRPVGTTYIACHDSFYPSARRGILSAGWQNCPWVHYIEVDFVPGVYHQKAFDTAEPRSMHGGLAVAVLKHEARTGELIVHQSQQGLYDAAYRYSHHADFKFTSIGRLLRGIGRRSLSRVNRS